MPAINETVDQVKTVEKYKYGFVTDIDSGFAPKGLSEDIVRFISAKKEEPAWLLAILLIKTRFKFYILIIKPT